MYQNADFQKCWTDFQKCWTNYPPPSLADKMCLRGGVVGSFFTVVTFDCKTKTVRHLLKNVISSYPKEGNQPMAEKQ